jgi:hypothetical protein
MATECSVYSIINFIQNGDYPPKITQQFEPAESSPSSVYFHSEGSNT